MTDSAPTPEPVRSLEARYYTDPEIFRLEQAGLLARTWQFAGVRTQIKAFVPCLRPHRYPISDRTALQLLQRIAVFIFQR